jgi:hypothetical protein
VQSGANSHAQGTPKNGIKQIRHIKVGNPNEEEKLAGVKFIE